MPTARRASTGADASSCRSQLAPRITGTRALLPGMTGICASSNPVTVLLYRPQCPPSIHLRPTSSPDTRLPPTRAP
jgi:hypothetical protein